MTIDSIAFTGKSHLSKHKEDISLCGKTAPFWYRVLWDGTSKGICKNCIKVLTKQAVKEQTKHVSPVP